MSKGISANEVFWLARYAHNTFAPLIKQAKEFEPSIKHGLDLTFGSTSMHLTIAVHWDRRGMFLYDIALTTKEQVDRSAEKLRLFIERERAARLDKALVA